MELAERHQIATKKLIAILSAAANEIKKYEIMAKEFLYERNDRQGYHDQLRQKSILLSELAEKVALCEAIPPHIKASTQEKIGSFSYEADRALRLDSIFYMSVLLYPEGYQEGTPNELEDFINSLMQQ